MLHSRVDATQSIGLDKDSLLNIALKAPDDVMTGRSSRLRAPHAPHTDCAADAERLSIIQLLLAAGADPTAAVPTPGVAREAVAGTVMDTLHHIYLRQVEAPTNRRESMILAAGSSGRRTSGTSFHGCVLLPCVTCNDSDGRDRDNSKAASQRTPERCFPARISW